MTTNTLDAQLRHRLESFANDIADLITRAAVEAVERGLETPTIPVRPARKRERVHELTPQPPPVELTPAPSKRTAGVPLSRDAYECMALQRAIAESGGSAVAAGKLLGMATSSLYRRMQLLGVDPKHAVPSASDPLLAAGVPVSVEAYDKAVIARAIKEAGTKLAAAKLLGVGKNTVFRLVKRYEIR